MQIWAQPDKLANFGLTVQDLQNALKDQNRESAAGVLGQCPSPSIRLTIPGAISAPAILPAHAAEPDNGVAPPHFVADEAENEVEDDVGRENRAPDPEPLGRREPIIGHI